MTELRCIASHTTRYDEVQETEEGPVAECLTCHQPVRLVPHLLASKRDTLVLDNHPARDG